VVGSGAGATISGSGVGIGAAEVVAAGCLGARSRIPLAMAVGATFSVTNTVFHSMMSSVVTARFSALRGLAAARMAPEAARNMEVFILKVEDRMDLQHVRTGVSNTGSS